MFPAVSTPPKTEWEDLLPQFDSSLSSPSKKTSGKNTPCNLADLEVPCVDYDHIEMFYDSLEEYSKMKYRLLSSFMSIKQNEVRMKIVQSL